MNVKTKKVSVNEVNVKDIIIAIMGPTGSGKSNIIDVLTQTSGEKRRAGDNLSSETQKVQAVRLRNHSKYKDRLVLLDTPGFNDTHRSDMEILQLISEWLQKTYEKHITLSGILYMHRITDNRLAGTPHRNLRVFGDLCGDRAAEKVVLITTMWDKVDRSKGDERESQLLNRYWAEMLKYGATSKRFDNSETTAWGIVDELVDRESNKAASAVLLQEEMVDLKKHLNETAAGKTVYEDLFQLIDKQRQTVERLARDAQVQQQPEVAAEMKAEQAKAQAQLQQTYSQAKALKIPFGRRIVLLFTKKPHAHAVTVPEPFPLP